MNIFIGWRSHIKNWDKLDITLRVSFLTILSIKADWSRKYYRINIMNMGIQSK